MLQAIGVSGVDELFRSLPEDLRLKNKLDLPPALSEPELVDHLDRLARRNHIGKVSFLGGGIYNHYIPAVVWTLVMRPEFATAYTPYQAEVAQGTLQVIYEFQTHLCRLTGMEVANASLYDAATAVAEAAVMAVNYTGRRKIVISETVNPVYREVLGATIAGRELPIETIRSIKGVTDLAVATGAIDENTACLILAQPNFFGYLEDLEQGQKAIHAAGGLFIQVFDPISLGIMRPPADNGADIAVGEGQSLGIPRSFGGPLLGLFTCRKEFVRRMPGRLSARTVDAKGRTGYVLTLQTREQHIRRDKATSNVCTNEALCAAAATIYLSLMGKRGLPRVAQLSTERAHYLADKVRALEGYSVWTDYPFFKEFVIETPVNPERIISEMKKADVAAGINLIDYFPDLDRHLMVAVTECVSYEECDRFVSHLSEIASGRQIKEKAVST